MDHIIGLAVAAILGIGVFFAIAGDNQSSVKSAGSGLMKTNIELQKKALLP